MERLLRPPEFGGAQFVRGFPGNIITNHWRAGKKRGPGYASRNQLVNACAGTNIDGIRQGLGLPTGDVAFASNLRRRA